MADQNTDTPVQPSYLEMSDEEIMNSSFPAEVSAVAAKEVVDEADDEPADTQAVEDTEVTDADDEDAGTAAEEDAAGADDKNEEEDSGAKAPKSESEQKPEEKAEESDKKTDEQAIDFEAEYKRLLAPFKANGRDIAVKSVDDAIALMQMGANYNKKMAALKPNLKLMKLLENNGLLSEDKIGFLIDLEKKNPAAINKLVKDSGIDPMDLDAEKASGYKQTAYTVDDREIELDTVLDEIQGSPSYNRTLEIVSTKWDAASKQVIAGNPQLLKVINGHVDSGIYDLISREVEGERLFGRLNGLSDIEAYRQVGDALHAKGAFNSLAQGSSQNQQKPATPPVVVTPKPKVEDDKLKDKRRAASSTKPAAPTSTPKDFNPLALSDEEFNKLVNKQFL
jgi:hypothetical protein